MTAAVRRWTGRWFDDSNQRLVWCLFYICYSGLLIILGLFLFMIMIDFLEKYCS
jgi:hypothetical protein